MSEKTRCSAEIPRDKAEKLKQYFRENGIAFEPSESGPNVYFSCEMSDEEFDKTNEFLGKGVE